MLVHRHVWNDGTFSNWHEASRAHSKEEYANDTVFEEREVAGRPKKGKQATPVLSFNEYGEPLTPADVDASVRLYEAPPEYAALDATALVREAAAHLMKTSAKNGVHA